MNATTEIINILSAMGAAPVAGPDSANAKNTGNAHKRKEKEKMSIIEKMKKALAEEKTRSACGRGVKEYAAELIAELEENIDGGGLKKCPCF